MDSFIHPFTPSSYHTLARTWRHGKDRGGSVGGTGLAVAHLEFRADNGVTMDSRWGPIMVEVCFRKIDLVVLHAGKKLEGGGPSHSNSKDATSLWCKVVIIIQG